MEGTHEPQTPPRTQADERATQHPDWRCDHTHVGAWSEPAPIPATLIQQGPAAAPHRHIQWEAPGLFTDSPVKIGWSVELAGPSLRCRGIEVREALGGGEAGAADRRPGAPAPDPLPRRVPEPDHPAGRQGDRPRAWAWRGRRADELALRRGQDGPERLPGGAS